MTTTTTPVLVIAALVLLTGCRTDAQPPQPTFDPVFPALTGQLMSMSSPALADLNGDGVLDIVFGTGVDRLRPEQGRYVFAQEPEPAGYVVAVSGATNEVLWRAPHRGEAFTMPRFPELDGDDIPDVVMGGREGALAAFSGRDGTAIWRVAPDDIATTSEPYNFFTPAPVDDVNGDGVIDLVVMYGGNDTRQPDDPRDAAYVVVLSGADGTILAAHQTPDGSESYSSVVVYERAGGTPWVVFGTGGETHPGAAYRAPLTSLLDGSFTEYVERLTDPGTKGVIAPATIVELTGDGELDIVISTFDGRLIVLDGSSRRILWQHREEGEEAYHPAAVMRVSQSGTLGLLVSRGVGTFPGYTGSVHRLHDARDGRVLYRYTDPFSPAGAPLAVDLTGDGIDEPVFFSLRFPRRQGARIHILHGASGELIVHDLPTNFAATPMIADPRGTGTLEMIGLSWSIMPTEEPPDWRDMRWHLLRLDLDAAVPDQQSWTAYMGTSGDGHYRGSAPVLGAEAGNH